MKPRNGPSTADIPEKPERRGAMPASILFLTGLLALLVIACMAIAYRRHDGTFATGLASSAMIVLYTLPMVVLAWLFAGFISALVPAEQSPAPAGKHSLPLSILISTGVFIAFIAAAMYVAYRRQDGSLEAGLRSSWKMFRESWLLLVVAWIFAGYAEALLPTEFVVHWLGRESGMRGIALACVAGGLTPGGVFFALPIAGGLYRAGASAAVLVTYLSAWALYAIGRLPFEIGFLGVRLTLIRWVSTCIFPPLIGLSARFLFER